MDISKKLNLFIYRYFINCYLIKKYFNINRLKNIKFFNSDKNLILIIKFTKL